MPGSGSADRATRRVPGRVPRRAAALAVVAASVTLCFGQPAPDAAGTAGTAVQADAAFRFPVGGIVTAGPAIAAGRVWLLSDSRTLYILTVDGVAIGKRTLADRRAAFIACDNFGRAVISEGGSGLALVNKAGQEVWRTSLGAVPATAPVFASDGRLFVAAGGVLSAFAPNGRLLWQSTLSASQSSPVVIGPGGGPAIGLADGSVLLFPPDGGAPWTVVIGAAPIALSCRSDKLAAALEDGRVVVLEREAAGHGLTVMQAGGGASLGARPLSLAASIDGFYALGTAGALLALDADGTERWRVSIQTGGEPAALAAFEGRVVALSKNTVWSYGSDGSMYRTLRLSNVVSMPAMAPDGTVFAGGSDWILYAYRFERPLVALEPPAVAAIDLEAVDAVAREESRWSLAPYDDSVVMERLLDIEKSIESGTMNEDAGYASLYLSAVALGRMEAPFGLGAAPSGPKPGGALPRLYACDLLGRMGLPRAVPILVEAFKTDDEPAVRAAAAAAVAAIGLDPGGGALEAFAGATERRLDARTATAIVDAIDALYRASGALDDRSGILALVRISGGAYPRDVRARAEKALERVSRPH